MKESIERASTCKATLVLLWLALGLFGGHRFYTGKYISGAIQLLTRGGLGIWWLHDLFLIVTGRFTDRKGRLVTSWFN